MDTVKIICDNCHKEVSPSQKQKRLKKGFFDIGLQCPLCGFWVHSHYSNAELQLAEKILENFKRHSVKSARHRLLYEKKIVEFMGQHKKVQEKVKKHGIA